MRFFPSPGACAVVYQPDKEAHIFKVKPATGSRFSGRWLDSVAAFAAHHQTAGGQKAAMRSPLPQPSATEHIAKSKTDAADPTEAAVVDCLVSNSVSSTPSAKGGHLDGSADGAMSRSSASSDHVSPGSPDGSPLTLEMRALSLKNRMAGSRAHGCPPSSNPTAAAAPKPVQLSIRLENMRVTDKEAQMLATWAARHSASGLLEVRKLWLFDNRLGDTGAVALAALFGRGLLEAHLSHNSIGVEGLAALLAAVPASPLPHQARCKGLWLRIEWNQIPEPALAELLEKERGGRGLVCNVMKTTSKASRGHEDSLQFSGGPAHVRLPWVHCQRLPPSAAPLLREARIAWRCPKPAAVQHGEVSEPAVPVVPTDSVLPVGDVGGVGKIPDAAADDEGGPLLVFPDTSALLEMLNDRRGGCFTMRALQEFAEKQRFGRSLPSAQQVFIVLADSVLKQLDGLKSDFSLCVAIRAFLGSRLDACGPAGLDFLTVLGAHEGEGVVVAADAEVTGSRSQHMADKGQSVDAKIVEVALFFQAELLAAANSNMQKHADGKARSPSQMPVVLLSSDNAQLHLARSHGLPAAKVSDLSAMPAALKSQQPLSAQLLRGLLRPAATAGLGSRAGRSLQTQFDQAVACLRAVHSQLVVVESALAATQADVDSDQAAGTVEAMQQCLAPSASPLSEAVAGKLVEWESLVASHQSASRILQWSVPLA